MILYSSRACGHLLMTLLLSLLFVCCVLTYCPSYLLCLARRIGIYTVEIAIAIKIRLNAIGVAQRHDVCANYFMAVAFSIASGVKIVGINDK